MNEQRDDFDWIVNQGPTSVGGTGPDNDHTTGNSQVRNRYYIINNFSYSTTLVDYLEFKVLVGFLGFNLEPNKLTIQKIN